MFPVLIFRIDMHLHASIPSIKPLHAERRPGVCKDPPLLFNHAVTHMRQSNACVLASVRKQFYRAFSPLFINPRLHVLTLASACNFLFSSFPSEGRFQFDCFQGFDLSLSLTFLSAAIARMTYFRKRKKKLCLK